MDHHSVLRDKIEHLIEDEMQSLRDRIEELEELLGIGEEDTNLIRVAIPDITPTEAQIVGFLRRRRGIISKEAIYAAIWAGRCEHKQPESRVIDTAIGRIRRKLEPLWIKIETVHGSGHCMDESSRARLTSLMEVMLGGEAAVKAMDAVKR